MTAQSNSRSHISLNGAQRKIWAEDDERFRYCKDFLNTNSSTRKKRNMNILNAHTPQQKQVLKQFNTSRPREKLDYEHEMAKSDVFKKKRNTIDDSPVKSQ